MLAKVIVYGPSEAGGNGSNLFAQIGFGSGRVGISGQVRHDLSGTWPSIATGDVVWFIEQPWRERPDGSVATSVAVRDHLVPHRHRLRVAGISVRVVRIADRGIDALAAVSSSANVIFSHTRTQSAARLMHDTIARNHRAIYLLPFDLSAGRLEGHHFLMASLADCVMTESELEHSIGRALIPANWALALPPINHARKAHASVVIDPNAMTVLVVALPGSGAAQSRLMSAVAGLDAATRRSLRLRVLADTAADGVSLLTGSRRFAMSPIDAAGLSTQDLHSLIVSNGVALTIFADCHDIAQKKRIRSQRDQLNWVGCPAAIANDGVSFQFSEDASVTGLASLVGVARDANRFGELFGRVQQTLYARHQRHAIDASLVRLARSPRLPDLGPSWPSAESGGQAAPTPHPGMVIVAGAHRSGTSLVAEILSTLGVHMGGDVDDEQHESAAFQQINEWLLNTAGANWDRPGRFLRTLQQPTEISTAIRLARRLARSSFLTQYWRGFDTIATGNGSRRLAGWKDPRNCLTWPIWRAVYPHARFVTVERDPIAAASSLVVRHRRVLYEAFARDDEDVANHAGLCFMINGMRVTDRCFSICGALDLVAEHRAAFDRLPRATGAPRHEVSYDELVAKPGAVIASLAAFLGLDPSPNNLARAIALVR